MPRPPRSVVLWLLSIYALICAMVLLGGVVRLTESGLSMVDWHPVTGVLPPLSGVAWRETFERYLASPQGSEVAGLITIEQFQRIFFWEWAHRVLGRSIGLVFLLPFVFFLATRRLRGALAARAGLAFLLGGLQGGLGWWMVRSGLVDIPEVSSFRLAAHLVLALLIAQWILWILLDLWVAGRGPENSPPVATGPRVLAWAFVGLVVLQIIYGAFMAGSDAGHLSDTFPHMNGHWGPGPWLDGDDLLHALLHSPGMIHWTHRLLAFALLAASAGLFGVTRAGTLEPRARRLALALLLAVAGQLSLGAAVVMLHVPVIIAVTHQGGAIVVLSLAVSLSHCLGNGVAA